MFKWFKAKDERPAEDTTFHHGALYGILDTRAGTYLGEILQVLKHDAVAIRNFGDVVALQNSPLAKHLKDYALVRVGHFGPDTNLILQETIILTGEQWAASQPQPTQE